MSDEGKALLVAGLVIMFALFGGRRRERVSQRPPPREISPPYRVKEARGVVRH